MSGALSRSLVDAAAAVLPVAFCESMGIPEGSRDAAGGSPEDWQVEARAAVAAVLETLAAHYYERAAQRGEASGDGPTCDGDCDNGDCHMTSAVAAWQMAAATAQRVTTELREGR